MTDDDRKTMLAMADQISALESEVDIVREGMLSLMRMTISSLVIATTPDDAKRNKAYDRVEDIIEQMHSLASPAREVGGEMTPIVLETEADHE